MDPVWMLFSRRTFSSLAYWLAALGYNLRDKSAMNRFYLVYFLGFWLLWAGAIFSLLGSSIAEAFNTLRVESPENWAVSLGQVTLAAWALLELWKAAQRSPFVFTEEDAYLLCQTPVSRRKVGLAWFLKSWLGTVMPFALGTVALTFALVEWRTQEAIQILMIGNYVKASLLGLGIVLPLQMALQALVWTAGAYRLQPERERPGFLFPSATWLRLAAPGLGLLLGASLLSPALSALVWAPLRIPLQAAFTSGSASSQAAVHWPMVFGLCLILLGLGLAGLWIATPRMRLGLAAQETTLQAAIQLARSYGQFELASLLRQRQKMGLGRSPSRLPLKPGGDILFWKDTLQSLRSVQLVQALSWALVLALSLGMFLPTTMTEQMILAGLWSIAFGRLANQRLRSDLARWWLIRSLPIPAERLLQGEIKLACTLGTLLGWLALALSGQIWTSCVTAAPVLPFLCLNAALGASTDILRRAKARVLMSPSLADENVPQQNLGGVVRGLLSVLPPFALLAFGFTHPNQIGWPMAAFLSAAILWKINKEMAVAAYQEVE